MKIIFDNEKQKDRFFEMIVRSDYCPESTPLFELHNHAKCPGNDFDEECSCKECWENSGIEIEIVKKDHNPMTNVLEALGEEGE